jgi:hypothetical protein
MLSFLNLQNEFESWRQFRKSSFWKSFNKLTQKDDEGLIEMSIREVDTKYPNSKIKELTTAQKTDQWQECFSYGNKINDHSNKPA